LNHNEFIFELNSAGIPRLFWKRYTWRDQPSPCWYFRWPQTRAVLIHRMQEASKRKQAKDVVW